MLKVLIASFFLVAARADAISSYTAINLGSLGGGMTWVTGINESGQVVGYSSLSVGGPYHAFFWQNNGLGMRDLGTLTPALDFSTSQAAGINDAGQVVGYSYSGVSKVFGTGPQGTGMVDLSPSHVWSPWASGINDKGQMVGGFNNQDIFPYTHAFIMNTDGTGFRDLGTLGGSAYSAAAGINSEGQVTGGAYAAGSSTLMHAFITSANGYGKRDLGTLGGNFSIGNAINNIGQVAGASYTTTGHLRAFLSAANGGALRDLGNLAQLDDFESQANALNDKGQVVGWSGSLSGMRAFVTNPDGTGMYDLNLYASLPAGTVLVEADAINELGQIVAVDATHHAYLLTPVPEPTAALMLLAGLASLGAMIRRKRQSRPGLPL